MRKFYLTLIAMLMVFANANAWKFSLTSPTEGEVSELGEINLTSNVFLYEWSSVVCKMTTPDGEIDYAFTPQGGAITGVPTNGINLTKGGTYTLTIHAGAFHLDKSFMELGEACEESTYTWTIPGGSGDAGGDADPYEGMIHLLNAGEMSITNNMNVSNLTVEDVTMTADKNTSQFQPMYQVSGGKSLWLYANNKITINAPKGKLIDRIAFKTIDGSESDATSNVGAFSNGDWTKEDGAISVSFTISDPMHITDIYVNVMSEGAPSATISAVKWSTYVTKTPVDFSNSGVHAYTVSAIVGNSIKLTEITEAPAEVAVLLNAETPDTYYFNPKEGVSIGTNLLNYNTYNHLVWDTDYWYCLAYGDQGIGFYPIKPNTTLAAYKGYLQIINNSPAKSYRMDIDAETTGVEGVILNKLDGTTKIYNLQGQRVNNAQKGIYIINGKKVIK